MASNAPVQTSPQGGGHGSYDYSGYSQGYSQGGYSQTDRGSGGGHTSPSGGGGGYSG
eukprot:CAMPEP_0119525878 /NCGR_PEP_ID=MMETSP1344-20130328/40587_1 /TAXON_ID=236787 /ORGANISM="Florenciella parvula, Strain CCMP2471" /LENGTH=56 /DNA_ID=CAMNT_0007564739 /DNA_START=21 /DNA_END=187 /DNA_ORIENTATION=-